MKLLAVVLLEAMSLGFLHHAVEHGSFWEGLAAVCVGVLGAYVLDA